MGTRVQSQARTQELGSSAKRCTSPGRGFHKCARGYCCCFIKSFRAPCSRRGSNWRSRAPARARALTPPPSRPLSPLPLSLPHFLSLSLPLCLPLSLLPCLPPSLSLPHPLPPTSI